jgi:signal peptidase
MARKIFNKVYKILSTIVITIGVILVITYLCGIRLYHVKSGSMGELLPVGSLCFVSTYSKYENIGTGDVISFKVDDDILVTHRAVRITDAGIYTKGDANNTEDPDAVTKDNYIGKTVFALPRVGDMFIFFRTTVGKVSIVTALILLIIMGRIYKMNDTEEKGEISR